MKKTILLLATVISTSLMAGATLTDVQIKDIVKNSKTLQTPALSVKKGEDLDTVYFLQLEAQGPRGELKQLEAFVDKKTGSIYIGGGYDKDGKKISFPMNVETVEKAVAFKYGNGEKQLYVVTDPECPYCVKFAQDSKGKLNDYTVNVILYPLAFHKKAKPMTAYIMDGKDNAEKEKRYSEIMLGGDTSYEKAKVEDKVLTDYLAKSNAAVAELGVRGTPTVFIKDGKQLNMVSWPTLIK